MRTEEEKFVLELYSDWGKGERERGKMFDRVVFRLGKGKGERKRKGEEEIFVLEWYSD